MSNHTIPPSVHLDDFKKGDILIQVLCNRTIAQWIILDIKGGGNYHLQLIDSNGLFTNKFKVVKGLGIQNFIKDAIATKLMKKGK